MERVDADKESIMITRVCPICKEKKAVWANMEWDASKKDIWTQNGTILFECGGKYKFTQEGFVEISKCGRVQCMRLK